MNKKNIKKPLKNLFYQLYVDILSLFKKKSPEIYSKNIYQYITKKDGQSGVATYPELFLKPNYHLIKDELFKLRSLDDIISLIEKQKDILNSDFTCSNSVKKKNIGKKLYEISGIKESFSGQIYAVVEKIIELHNQPKFSINWNFLATPAQELKIEEKDLLESFKKTQKTKQIAYYFLENFKMQSDELAFQINNQKITIKKLSDQEKSLLLNASEYFNSGMQNNIHNINVAIISNAKIETNTLNKILFLLRVFKGGVFRYEASGLLVWDNISKKQKFQSINNQGSCYEAPLPIKWSVPSPEDYLLEKKDEKNLKIFIENNIRKITDKFNFINDVFAKLHSLGNKYSTQGTKYQIPFLMMGLESFFNINEKITFTMSLLIAKVLNDDSLFPIMKKLYAIRSDIIHGNKNELKKDILKLKTLQTNLKNIDDVTHFLEDITRNITKIFIEKELHTDQKFDQEICDIFLKNKQKLKH